MQASHNDYPPLLVPRPQGVVRGTASMRGDLGGALQRAFRLVRVLSFAGFLGLGLLQGTAPREITWFPRQPEEFYSPAHLRLLESFGPNRPISARLSGQWSYQPYQPSGARRRAGIIATTRGGNVAQPQVASAVSISREISSALLRAEETEPSPENLAALAVLSLVAGEPARAVQDLRQALATKPADPRLLNDLAGSLLADSEATGDPRLAFEAVETAQRALRARFSLPALFNAALSLERLGLRARAAAAWRSYLEQDPRSGWAQEAAGRLDQLDRQAREARAEAEHFAKPEFELDALGRNPWADRQFGERTLLARWGERTLAADRTGAAAALAESDAVASTLTAGGRRLLEASVAVIREAERTADQVRLNRLARGHVVFVRAFRLRRSERSSEANSLLGAAIDDLHAAGSPFELRARLLRAVSSPDPDWTELQLVERVGREKGFSALVAEAKCQAAYWMSLEGRLAAALDAYEDAGRGFATLGEREISAVVAVMRAEIFDAMGNETSALGELALALAGVPLTSDAWNRYSIYVVAASATTGSFRRSAVELRREAAEVCRDLPERPLCAVDSLLWVARLALDGDVAGDAFLRADQLLAVMPDSDGKQRTGIDLEAARAQWLGGETRPANDQERAVDLLADAAQRYKDRGLVPSAARTHAEEARVLERLGRGADSAAEYREALRTFRFWDETDRAHALGAERLPPDLRAVYERLLDLELDTAGGAPSRAAFLLAEEMHDRLAPRRVKTSVVASNADLEQLIVEVPTGTAIVEYALGNGRATAWIVEGGRLDQVVLTPSAGLAKRIRAIAAIRDLDGWKRRTSGLFRELLAPVMSHLAAGTVRLVVIPDGDLYDLPFRALWDAASGLYLDEELTVALAPSMRQALIDTDRRPRQARGSLAGLSLGFTRFASDLGLSPLARAGEEAAAVQAIYGDGHSACMVSDWESFRRCAPQAEVIHLATHAAADSTSSGTWLAFPRETVNLDRLWRELPELPSRPLVVLSSCQSAATAGGGEGLGGLARPFLASGARAVVGTLWRIDDNEAASVFPALHRAYRKSGNAALALREAREVLTEWRSRPWVWGGCVAIAGVEAP